VPNDTDAWGLIRCAPTCAEEVQKSIFRYFSLIARIYRRGCLPPQFICAPNDEKDCKSKTRIIVGTGRTPTGPGAVFDHSANTVKICWRNWLKQANSTADFGEFVVRHELTHALDNCRGIDWEKKDDENCAKRVCSEIRAYSTDTSICQEGGIAREICLKNGVQSSVEFCGHDWRALRPKFEKIWKKCYVPKGKPLPPFPFEQDDSSPFIPRQAPIRTLPPAPQPHSPVFA